MWRFPQKLVRTLAFTGLLLGSLEAFALEFRPGVGVGLEYTDNARLAAEETVDDLIAVGYLGFSLADTEGPVLADITASLNHHRYTKDSFEDQRYLNLGAIASWEMIEQGLEWFLQNFYGQRPIDSTDPNTPNNIQDSNIFAFGANINLPITARNTIRLTPEYRSFYYELQATDNQQLSLVSAWNYLLDPLTTVGLNASVRTIDYDEPAITDVSFASVFLSVSTTRARSAFITNLGSTRVERDNGQSTEEFAGNLDWSLNLTDRSRVRAFVSTDLTDGSTAVLNATLDPATGDPNDLQVTTDVIRNKVFTLGYSRQDGTLDSSLTGQLREVNYSESPDDRRIRSLSAVFNYPVTALVTSGVYARYSHTENINIQRTDNDFSTGANVRYQLSRNISSAFDLRYRNRDSTDPIANFTEWSAFVTLVYGFGQPMRPTRAGGF